MAGARPSLGFGDETGVGAGGFAEALDGLDPAEWGGGAAKRPEREAALRSASAAGFRSREPERAAARPPAPVAHPAAHPVAHPAAAPGARPLRRRRTGRNAQFNIKARPDTIEAFCAVADGQGWGLGETLEHAVELLRRTYGAGEAGGAGGG